jgi:tetratricopeptide (TPR) repeat protein
MTMSRILVGCFRSMLPALGLLAALALPAHGEEQSFQSRVLGLDNITGTDVLQGEVRNLLDNQDEAKKLIQAALDLAKNKKGSLNFNAALVLADVAGQMKDLKSSELFYRICMDKAAKLESASKLSLSYGGYIELLFRNKKYAEAERVCRELLELKTGDGKPREVLVAIPTRFGDIDFVPDDEFSTNKGMKLRVHRLMILAIAEQGKYDLALKLTDNLVKSKDHWLNRELKASVLRQAGKLTEAAEVYADVVSRVGKDKSIDKETRDDFQDRYRYRLSSIYVEMNQIDKASELLQALLDKHPDNPSYANDLGYIWADHNMKLPEAEKLIRKALQLDEKRRKNDPELQPQEDHENGAYLDSLGWVLFKQKKFKEAKEVMLKAVEDKDSQHIEIYDHLGDILLALGEQQAAVDAWRRGLEFVTSSRRDQERKSMVEKKLQKYGK